MKIPGILLCVLLALMTVQGLYFHSRMPEQMATQIDREGNPRSWMGRGEFFIVYSGMAGFLGAIFLLVPLSSNKAPATLMKRSMTAVKAAVMWAGAGTLAFLLGIGHFTFRANLGERAVFRERADLVLIGYGVFLVIWIILFLRALRPGSSSQGSGC